MGKIGVDMTWNTHTHTRTHCLSLTHTCTNTGDAGAEKEIRRCLMLLAVHASELHSGGGLAEGAEKGAAVRNAGAFLAYEYMRMHTSLFALLVLLVGGLLLMKSFEKS